MNNFHPTETEFNIQNAIFLAKLSHICYENEDGIRQKIQQEYNFPNFALIEKTERNIRDDFSNFNILKYEFQFLTQIQKFDTMNAITDSKSYAMGIALGKMARPFAAWRDDCPIKSFEKNYVGNLSKRITNPLDLTKFSNFLNEKLTMHEKNYKEQKSAYLDLMANFKALQEGEKYDRNACALGFFESYFSRTESKPETQNQQ